MLIPRKIVCCSFKTVQSINGPYPKLVLAVFINMPDIVIAYTIGVLRVILINSHLVAIIFVQAIAGPKPNEAPAILENDFNGAV